MSDNPLPGGPYRTPDSPRLPINELRELCRILQTKEWERNDGYRWNDFNIFRNGRGGTYTLQFRGICLRKDTISTGNISSDADPAYHLIRDLFDCVQKQILQKHWNDALSAVNIYETTHSSTCHQTTTATI